MVGASGSASERVAVVTASARSFPALMYSIDAGMGSKPTCTCPARRSITAGPLPRRFKQRAEEVGRGPSARRRHADLARVGLGVGNELRMPVAIRLLLLRP
jgi:hypothetical protein